MYAAMRYPVILLCLSVFTYLWQSVPAVSADAVTWHDETWQSNLFDMLTSSILNDKTQPPSVLTEKQLKWWQSLGEPREMQREPLVRKEYRQLTKEEQQR